MTESERQTDVFKSDFLIPFGYNENFSNATFPSVFTLIRDGFLNEKEFRSEVEKIRDAGGTPEQRFLGGKYNELEDSEFESLCTTFVEKVQANEIFDVGMFNRVASLLLTFSRDRLISLSTEEIVKLLKESLNKVAADGKLKTRDWRERQAPFIGEPSKVPGLVDFFEYSKSIEEKELKREKVEELSREFANFKSGKVDRFDKLFESFDWNVFKVLPVQEIFDSLMAARNADITAYRVVFAHRYKRPSAIAEEISELKEMHALLEEDSKKEPKLSRRLRLNFQHELERNIRSHTGKTSNPDVD